MFDLGSQWGLLTVIGPVVLAIAVLWAIFHNRGSRREVAETEAATRENYDRQDADDKLGRSQS